MRSTHHPVASRAARLGLVGLLAALAPSAPASAQIEAPSQICTDFKLRLDVLGFFDLPLADIADEGWVWLQRGDPSLPRFVSASGLVTRSGVARNDTPANHDSHDQNADVLVDPGQEGLLSVVNKDHDGDGVADQLELEWETGIRPHEKTGDGAAPTFPKWAWPSVGDRVWANGHWILDCGHPEKRGGVTHYRTEIHPPRALASMRNQVHRLPGSGGTPLPATAVDLYVHGRAGYVIDQLECGMGIMLKSDPNSCPRKTTAIDEDFVFGVCLPPRPSPVAIPSWQARPGPGNTLAVPLQVEVVPADAGCTNGGGKPLDTTTMLRVTAPLAGSGARPQDVYARQLVAGWISPPDPPLRRLALTLDRMDLHDDHEPPGFDGELTFFWLNVDRAPDEWHRLVDFEIPTPDDSASVICGAEHINRLNDYDDDGGCGNGELEFSGPSLDFFVRPGQSVHLRTIGYDQDCYDGHFGDHHFGVGMYVTCNLNPIEPGNNDALDSLDLALGPDDAPPYRVGFLDAKAGNDFELEFFVEELPPGPVNAGDLAIEKSCATSGEVALVGEPVPCAIRVTNAGPGLPRGVTVEDQASLTPAGAVGIASVAATTRFDGRTVAPSCAVAGPALACDLETVPVGGETTIDVELVPGAAGRLRNVAEVASADDPNPANNRAEASLDVFQGVDIDVRPRRKRNRIRVGSRWGVRVALLSDSAFDARQVEIPSVCFGSATDPPRRSCVALRGRGRQRDVDRDGDVDLVLKFRIFDTGIKLGEPTACVKGRDAAGRGFFGCGEIVTR